jgi:protein LSM14
MGPGAYVGGWGGYGRRGGRPRRGGGPGQSVTTRG